MCVRALSPKLWLTAKKMSPSRNINVPYTDLQNNSARDYFEINSSE